jgi:hypothetical protein
MGTGIKITGPNSEAEAIHAISTFHQALNALMVQPAIQDVINQSAQKVAIHLNIDEAALATFLTDKLPSYLANINTADADWLELLSRWCMTVVENRALNILKHRKCTEKNHEDLITHLNSTGKRNQRRVLKTDTPTPEEVLSQKEEARAWQARAIDLRDRVRGVLTEDVVIAKLWIEGYTPKEIAKILNKPAKTVYGKIGKMHKAVVQEIGFTPSDDNKGLLKPGLRQLISKSLEGIALDSPYLEQKVDISGKLVN